MALTPQTPPGQAAGGADEIEGLVARLETFRGRLRIFAARRLRDWEAAEDVSQETLIRVHQALREGRIRNLDALPGYIFQTAARICLHRIRSAGRERRALERLGSSSAGPDDEPTLPRLISAEERLGVLGALAQMDADDRTVLELTFRDELDSAEIGRRLGISAGAVCVRRHRAIRRLAKRMGVTRAADRGLGD
jgi:RNA polymerase sigma-70 factor (ECF subfamily)